MKIFLAASLLISATAYSCPELSGTYRRCENSRLKVEIRQNDSTFHISTSKALGDETYHADGRPDVISFIEPNTGVKIEITTISNCSDDSLKAFRTYAFDGEVLGTHEATFKKLGSKLILTNLFKTTKDEVREEFVCLP